MNPYTYKKRSDNDPQPPAAPAMPMPPQSSWAKDIFNAQISSLVAMTFVAFAAGSVMAMTAAATPEVAMGGSDSAVAVRHIQKPQVLGESTIQNIIDDSALEAGDPTGSLSVKPGNFDSTLGRWNFNISYSVSNLRGSATLSIGKYTVASNITASGSIDTGTILKTNMVYRVFLWSQDSSGAKQILAKTEIKTGKAKNSVSTEKNPRPACVPPQVSSNGTSTQPSSFCVKKDDGSVQCAPPVCGFIKPDQHGTGTSDSSLKPPFPPLKSNSIGK